MSFLHIQNLHKSYGPTQIFTDINIEIGQGQFITLLGPS
ncbi:MAG TPA: spermidine/putrescine ABC transporter ATP-binding protein, partial [Pseudomonas sp.]|nr:spermidine/putrescine ABC transporter ATP-binding protein [Pseudomonas sp.]